MPGQIKICNRVSGINAEEAGANADLIAAAPDLLESLDQVMTFLHECLLDGTFDMMDDEEAHYAMVARHESVIKKAKGETS